ncbi:putative methyltransferase-domain-containing protein [Stachybotrys elegans]|uniref:Methyltransferase-domain-containing protein n=1 Tax=Stachybotrys elegans TaxID=80388 RepID=A0A8K0WP85_9HYPO|nr:putative methyltransferase-domain-containing protein [Stachybotrys elegans]
MHYIRLLRSPKLAGPAGNPHVELAFTITTDLGDSFLYPEEPLSLSISIHTSSAAGNLQWRYPSQLSWQSGMRIAKPKVGIPRPVQMALKAGHRVELTIGAEGDYQAAGVQGIMRAADCGLVMPVWTCLHQDGDGDVDVSTRRISLGREGPLDGAYLEVEEEIGESIARHIWDAGVVAFCAVTTLFFPQTHASPPVLQMPRLRETLTTNEPLNVIEIGCGVGILGIGFASVCAAPCTILLTDLEEAESRTRSNIARWQQQQRSPTAAQLTYENLDWEDGREGRFGPQVCSRRWDVVMISDCTYNVDMLPALVETLSALHVSNMSHSKHPSRVFLATKPRHESERALFQLMDQHGWGTVEHQVLPLPVLGAEAESVELYLFEKV